MLPRMYPVDNPHLKQKSRQIMPGRGSSPLYPPWVLAAGLVVTLTQDRLTGKKKQKLAVHREVSEQWGLRSGQSRQLLYYLFIYFHIIFFISTLSVVSILQSEIGFVVHIISAHRNIILCGTVSTNFFCCFRWTVNLRGIDWTKKLRFGYLFSKVWAWVVNS